MASSAPAVKTALVALLTSLYAADQAVGVSYGHPGPSALPDLVAVMGVTAEQDPGPLRVGPGTREERLRITVLVSCYVGGGPEAQPVATERAYALLAQVEDSIRLDPSIGGVVRRAQMVEHELAEAESFDPQTEAAVGRVAEISAVIATETRV